MAAALDQLGGRKVFRRPPSNLRDLHVLIKHGFPMGALEHFTGSIETLSREHVLAALGVSSRTIQRRLLNHRLLSAQESGHLWRLAQVMAKAIHVFGDQAAAERWMSSAIPALDHEVPVELMTTPVGAAMVEDHLGRLEYGVYT